MVANEHGSKARGSRNDPAMNAVANENQFEFITHAQCGAVKSRQNKRQKITF